MKIKKRKVLLIAFSVIYVFLLTITNANGVITSVAYALYIVFLTSFCLYLTQDPLAPSSLFVYFYVFFLGFGVLILDRIGNNIGINGFFYVSEGLLAFVTGILVSSRNKKNQHIVPQQLGYRSVYCISEILCSFGNLIGAFFIITNFSYIYSNLEGNRISVQSGNGVYMYLMTLVIPCGIMMYDCCLRGVKGKYLWFHIALGATIMTLSGSRSRLIELFLGLLLVRNKHKKVKSNTVIKTGIAGLLIVAGLGVLRSNISGLSTSFVKKILNVLYVNVINLGYVFKTFPSRVPYQYGVTYLMNFAMFLPGSQQDFTLWIKDAIGVSFAGGGVTPSIIGESYLNFGNFGIVIIMFFLGILLKKIDNDISRDDNFVPWVILTLYLCKSVTGGLANIVIRLLFYEIVVCGISFLTKRRHINDIGYK